MSIKKVMTMFALLMGIACASYAQGVTNDSTATAKEDGLELVKDVYPQTEEDGDLYHGLTKKLMFDRMIPPHGLEVTYDKTVHILFPAAVRYVDLGSPNLIAGKADGAENVIRVKATVKNFRNETNMSVITEDGSFYTFNVKYADEPLILNVEMKDFIHDGSTVNRPNWKPCWWRRIASLPRWRNRSPCWKSPMSWRRSTRMTTMPDKPHSPMKREVL